MKINWSVLLNSQIDKDVFTSFANGKLSGRQLYSVYVYTELGGYVRNALRTLGVAKFRSLAKRRLAELCKPTTR